MKAFAGKRVLIGVIAVAVLVALLAVATYLKRKEDLDKKVLSHIELGHSHFLKGDIDNAFDEYQKAWALKPKITNPDERNSAVNLAQIMRVKGMGDKTKDLLLKVVEYDPFFYAAYLFLGDISLSEKDAEKAVFYLEKGLSLQAYFMKDDPNTALLYYNMAEAHMLKNNNELAKKNLESFITMAGQDKRLEGIVAKAKEKLKKL